MRQFIPNCRCGSGEEAELRCDARSIPLGYFCRVCWPKKKESYRHDVLTNPGYVANEVIEPEDY